MKTPFLEILEAFSSVADEINSHTWHWKIIDDNKTRQNLTYLLIHWAICLRRRIEKFYSTCFSKHNNFSSLDIHSGMEWEEPAIFKSPFDLSY